MFKLNLIRDRAIARARRRVVSLVCIALAFFAVLATGGIVYMYLMEKTATNEQETELNRINAVITGHETRMGNFVQLRERTKRENEIYSIAKSIVNDDRRLLFTPLVVEMAKIAENNETPDPRVPKRWFHSIVAQRDSMVAGRAQNEIGILRPMIVTGTCKVAVVGTEGVQDEQRRAIEDFWNQSKLLHSMLGRLSLSPAGSTGDAFGGGPDGGPQLSGEKQWTLEFTMSTNPQQVGR